MGRDRVCRSRPARLRGTTVNVMLTKIPKATVFLPALLALLLAACGGGSQSSQTLSKAQLIKHGDAVCEKAGEEKARAFPAYIKENPTSLKSKAGVGEIITAVVVPELEEELEGLKQLGTPTSGATEFEAIIAALEAAIAEAEDRPHSLTEQGKTPIKRANRLAGEYGFTVCNELI